MRERVIDSQTRGQTRSLNQDISKLYPRLSCYGQAIEMVTNSELKAIIGLDFLQEFSLGVAELEVYMASYNDRRPGRGAAAAETNAERRKP